MINTEIKNIVIVGGGFAGIKAALRLKKKNLKNCKIILITNKHHFNYYPRIYKAVVGESALEICVHMTDIFPGKKVELVFDKIINVDLENKTITGESESIYKYDELVLALGSETTYFNIPGLKEKAFGFKSIDEALKLKKHIHKMFDLSLSSKEDGISNLNIVIVGGGPSGVELAGKLTFYLNKLAKKHSVDSSFITIDLIEGSSRLLPTFPEKVSNKIFYRLHKLGVNIFLNRLVVEENLNEILTHDLSFKSKTLIWTAGVKINSLFSQIKGLEFNSHGRVIVDEYLRAKNFNNVYILGDAADTKYSGLAQTAIYDGNYVGNLLYKKYTNRKLKKYVPSPVSFVLPVGHYWAVFVSKKINVYGYLPYFLRELVDFNFFLSILPLRRVFGIFFSKKASEELCETCKKMI